MICSLERRGLRLGMCIRETYTQPASSIDGHRRTDTKENARLKRAVADLTLDKAILKEIAEGKW